MPGRKFDQNGKMYAWSDDGFSIYRQMEIGIMNTREIADQQEYPKVTSKFSTSPWGMENIITLKESESPDYVPEKLHGYNQDGFVYLENRENKQSTYIVPDAIGEAKEHLRYLSGLWEKRQKNCRRTKNTISSGTITIIRLSSQNRTRGTSWRVSQRLLICAI